MKKVFKYPLDVADVIELMLPRGATILHCDEQNGQICCWALVDPDAPLESRLIRMAGTGHPIRENVKRHINSIQMRGGALVFHFFEL